MLVSLSTERPVSVAEVGGKAASLIRLHQIGLPSPDGAVLTSAFFAPWVRVLTDSAHWRETEALFQSAGILDAALTAKACDQLKALSATLPLSAEQDRVLASIAPDDWPHQGMAVRSSSPEEDLAGASFAGMYETVLHVAAVDLEAAVRTCFASCLDARVLQYKRQMGFSDLTPSLAVVVQHMVASEVSGVAFSINPTTNDYDELLINASWGVGDALVTGELTPDRFVVNKVTGAVVEQQAGDKGGERSSELSIDADQIDKLVRTMQHIETQYGSPMDVEWAFTDGAQLHVLQARPITTYVPLHRSLLTAPGEQRHLYMDGYLTDGVTMSVATTPMTDNVFKFIVDCIVAWMLAMNDEQRRQLDLGPFGIHLDTGRFYLDLSMFLHLLGKGDVIAARAREMNPMMAAILVSKDLDRYRLPKRPKQLGLTRLLAHMPRVLWNARPALTVLFNVVFRAEHFDASYNDKLAAFDQWVRGDPDYSQTLEACLTESLTACGQITLAASYPAYVYLYLMIARIKGLVDQTSPEQVALANAVCGGYEKDMVVQMGILLYDMAMLVPESEFLDLNALEEMIKKRQLPQAFHQHWDDFVHQYGCRGPLEMEIANPKYGDSARLILLQLKNLALAGGVFNPHEMHGKRIKDREAAFARLQKILPKRKARKLEKAYRVCLRYSDAREYFKHHLLQCYARARLLLLRRAEEFTAAGRLDCAEQIFDLTIADVDAAQADPELDLPARARERSAFASQLKSQVRHFPMCIDSRGRILRGAVQIEDGALVGAAVSPGVARGPIKVLSAPFEKEVAPGDVLVAVTTDPGWTPLFINVSAVILEIGGELQHGALVAREYGKPCVSSIPDVTSRFTDGQMVEVDGTNGIVRFIDPVDAEDAVR